MKAIPVEYLRDNLVRAQLTYMDGTKSLGYTALCLASVIENEDHHVDLEPVIYCKDCDFHEDHKPYCLLRNCVVKDDGFCKEALHHGREATHGAQEGWKFVRAKLVYDNANYVDCSVSFCPNCHMARKVYHRYPNFCENCGADLRKRVEEVPEKQHTKCEFCDEEKDCMMRIWPDTTKGTIYASYVCEDCEKVLKKWGEDQGDKGVMENGTAQ